MSNTPKLSRFVKGTSQFDSIRAESNRTTGSQAMRHNDNMNEFTKLQIFFYVSHKSTSGMTGRHQGRRIVSNRLESIDPPHSPSCRFFLSVAQIDFRDDKNLVYSIVP